MGKLDIPEARKCNIAVNQVIKISWECGVQKVILVGETFVPKKKRDTMRTLDPSRYSSFGEDDAAAEAKHEQRGLLLLWRIKKMRELFAQREPDIAVKFYQSVGEADALMASAPVYFDDENIIIVDNDSDALVQLCLRTHKCTLMRSSTSPYSFYDKDSILQCLEMTNNPIGIVFLHCSIGGDFTTQKMTTSVNLPSSRSYWKFVKYHFLFSTFVIKSWKQ